MPPRDLDELVDLALAEVARRITGEPHPPMRPGQVQLSHDILRGMRTTTHVLGCAPTGVGKGVAAAVPAFLLASTKHQRSLFSTESKALQSQLVEKDFPLVAAVVRDLTGAEVTFAIHKGFNNYACPAQAFEAGRATLDAQSQTEFRLIHPDKGAMALSRDAEEHNGEEALSLSVELASAPQRPGAQVEIDGRAFPRDQVAQVASWALYEAATDAAADRSEYPGEMSDLLWSKMSVAPDECVGAKCPLVAICPPRLARERAAAADILVTNHTILALQASLAVPVAISNDRLGELHHLVVDEAHALPGTVRSTGERVVSGARIRRLLKMTRELVGSDHQAVNRDADLAIELGEDIAAKVDYVLLAFSRDAGGKDAAFEVTDNPIEPYRDAIKNWATQVADLLPKAGSAVTTAAEIRVRRLRNGLTSLVEDVETTFSQDSYARWVSVAERGPRNIPTPEMCCSPVDVAPAIVRNLFSRKAPETPEERREREAEDLPAEMRPMSVTMMSATLPPGFARESGIDAPHTEYASPFDAAYGASMLYVPKVTDAGELARFAHLNANGRSWRLDTTRHAQWAEDKVVELVRANNGHALVLASTVRAGQRFAEALRLAGVPKVLSQWDGLAPRLVVDKWRSDPASVLVGTRSMMTGVDASGETCSLVIIDRAPRNPGNIVDDARVSMVQRTTGKDSWAAQREVYVADATLLLEQAVGRLVRSVSDSGLAVVLDPRLVKNTPISYPEHTRAMFMHSLRRFSRKTTSYPDALAFLADRQSARAA